MRRFTRMQRVLRGRRNQTLPSATINKVACSLKDIDFPGWETPEFSVEWGLYQREGWDDDRSDWFARVVVRSLQG